MCHITGGGDTDLQPIVEAVIASPEFARHWEAGGDLSKGDMASTRFRNREEPSLSIIISRAKSPGQRLDRVQVIATATYELNRKELSFGMVPSGADHPFRSEEHTSELQSLMRNSYAVFCLKKINIHSFPTSMPA